MDVITYLLLQGEISKQSAELSDEISDLSDKIDAFPDGFNFLGAVDYYGDLPSSGNLAGDCYLVRYKGSSGTDPDGTRYAWGELNGTEDWIQITFPIELAETDGVYLIQQTDNVMSLTPYVEATNAEVQDIIDNF